MDWRELSVCSFHVLLFLSTQTHLQTYVEDKLAAETQIIKASNLLATSKYYLPPFVVFLAPRTSATQESKEGINFCTKPTSIPYLTPKGQRVFLLKIASKQPLLKTSRIVQNWNQCWYFQQ
jgi:hypothetical protein